MAAASSSSSSTARSSRSADEFDGDRAAALLQKTAPREIVSTLETEGAVLRIGTYVVRTISNALRIYAFCRALGSKLKVKQPWGGVTADGAIDPKAPMDSRTNRVVCVLDETLRTDAMLALKAIQSVKPGPQTHSSDGELPTTAAGNEAGVTLAKAMKVRSDDPARVFVAVANVADTATRDSLFALLVDTITLYTEMRKAAAGGTQTPFDANRKSIVSRTSLLLASKKLWAAADAKENGDEMRLL